MTVSSGTCRVQGPRCWKRVGEENPLIVGVTGCESQVRTRAVHAHKKTWHFTKARRRKSHGKHHPYIPGWLWSDYGNGMSRQPSKCLRIALTLESLHTSIVIWTYVSWLPARMDKSSWPPPPNKKGVERPQIFTYWKSPGHNSNYSTGKKWEHLVN